MIKKGTFVRIEKTILKAEERTAKIPEDTKATPFKMWTKGILQHDCEIGQQASIISVAQREDSGTLVEDNPFYLTHKIDKRGRIYSQGYAINVQGNSYQKSLIDLVKKDYIEVPDDYFS